MYNIGVFGKWPNRLLKMRIIYFTTATSKEDYASFSAAWKSSLNTSIQNLHNRLIRSLALTHEVDVISIRPFSRNLCQLSKLEASTRQEGRITWHNLEIKRYKFTRYLSVASQCNKILARMNLKDCIIITDTLNPNVLNNSTKLARKYNLPIIGVCHGTPSNIKNTGKSYTTFVLGKAMNLSGYISLTPGLNDLFNKSSRANLTFEGIADDKCQKFDKKPPFGKYIYYNGSLEEKYGVYELIKAFKELDDQSINLVISGYHGNAEHLKEIIGEDKNIINMGMVQNDQIVCLSSHSMINVNPCPYSEDFDRYVIPETMVDYLSAPTILVSVRNRQFKKNFEDGAIWIKSNEVLDLLHGIKAALNMKQEDKNNKIKKANMDASKLYSMEVINHRIIRFLKQFIKQKE